MTNDAIRVLLVDDEPDFVDMLSLRLEAAGLAVRSVSSGRECLDLLDRQDFDVIVLDLLMPGLSGVNTLEELRLRGCRAQVVIMTGHGPDQELERCRELGAYATLLKPAEFEQVLTAITGAHQSAAA